MFGYEISVPYEYLPRLGFDDIESFVTHLFPGCKIKDVRRDIVCQRYQVNFVGEGDADAAVQSAVRQLQKSFVRVQ